MTNEDFEKILLERVKKIGILCTVKGEQYATQKDRLHNFKSVAKQLNCTPERALLGMVIKQWTWIIDRVEDLGFLHHPLAEWDERIGDVIIYMILLGALRHEANEQDKRITTKKSSQKV